MWEYSDTVKKYFINPVNVGEIENPDGIGEVGSLACGDTLKLTFKLDSESRIVEAKFQTFGCASAIASSSALTELIMGKTLEQAEKITNKDIVDYLGGLPKEKMHCSVMGEQALAAAIRNCRGLEPLVNNDATIICQCFRVIDKDIERIARINNLRTVDGITNYTKAGGGCGNCIDKIDKLLIKLWSEPIDTIEFNTVPLFKKKLTNVQKIKLIEEILNREVRPTLREDGGDIKLIDIDKNVVMVSLHGICSSCSASQTTLGQFIQNKLREFVAPELIIREVKS